MEPTTVIAIYAAVVSTIVLLIQVAEFSRNTDDLHLSISGGVVMGMRGMPDHVIQVTVASRGGRPVGVSSLSLRLTDRRSIPLMEHLDVIGSQHLPAVLERGQFATYWLGHASTQDVLRQAGGRLDKIVATLTDGRTVEKSIDGSFRKLGD